MNTFSHVFLSWISRRTRVRLLLLFCIVFAASLAFGFHAWPRTAIFDDYSLYNHSLWVLKQYGLIDKSRTPSVNGKWTSAPWPLILGIASEYVFRSVGDPIAVRHAMNIALLPTTILAVFLLLRRAGFARSTSLLGATSLLGVIRFGGHALTNLRDFPHAASFVLVSLYLWVLLRDKYDPKRGYKPSTLAVLGAVSTIPFLTRSPDLFHYVLVLAGMAILAIGKESLSPYERSSHILIPLLAGALTIFLFSPILWQTQFTDWLYPFQTFSRFKWGGPRIRLFGMTYPYNALPRWYLFTWIPVVAQPITLLAAAVGWYIIFRKRGPAGTHVQWDVGGMCIRFSLIGWLAAIILLSWLTTIIIHPYDYGQDRHVHFLYPLLFLTGALGLDRFSTGVKYTVFSLMTVWSTLTYAQWGNLSYIYTPPFIPDPKLELFNGEYRGICLSGAIEALQTRVPNGAVVYIHSPPDTFKYHRNANANNRQGRTYRFVGKRPKKRPYALIRRNVQANIQEELEDIAEGRATLLWERRVPSGAVACILSWYP